jgi:hypothetical protein
MQEPRHDSCCESQNGTDLPLSLPDLMETRLKSPDETLEELTREVGCGASWS